MTGSGDAYANFTGTLQLAAASLTFTAYDEFSFQVNLAEYMPDGYTSGYNVAPGTYTVVTVINNYGTYFNITGGTGSLIIIDQ